MSTAGIVTLIGVFIVVGALAVYLAMILKMLYRVNFVLGTVLVGVRAIAFQCEPVNDVVDGIVEDVTAIQGALEGLVAKATQPAAERVGRPAVTNN